MPPKKGKKEKTPKEDKKEKETTQENAADGAELAAFELPDKDEEVFTRVAEFDVSDLSPEFFDVCNKLVQILMENNRRYEAAKVKRLSDMLYLLHSKFVAEVAENERIRPHVERADVKLQIALELSASTHDVISHMQQSLAHAWRVADASQAREQDTQKKLEQLVLTCESTARKEEKDDEDAAEMGKLGKYKNIILRERDRLASEVTDYEKRLQLQRYYTECLEYINKNYEDTINKYLARTRALESEKTNLTLKLKQHQSSIEELKEMNGKAMQKLDETTKELQDTTKRLDKKTKEYENQRHLNDKQTKDLQVINRHVSKLEQEIRSLNEEMKKSDEQLLKLRLEDRAKGNTIKQYELKMKQVQQDAGNLATKLIRANKTISSSRDEITLLKNTIHAKDKDIASERHRVDEITRLKESVQNERENLRSETIKLNNQLTSMKHSNLLLLNANDSFRLDISKLNVKLDENKLLISKIERERNEVEQELDTLQKHVEDLKEQILMKSDQIIDLTEKLQQKTKQVFDLKRQLEDAHTITMTLQRNLDTCTQERDALKKHQTLLNHQIVQLTDELLQTNAKINSLNLTIDKIKAAKKEVESQLKVTTNFLANVRRDLKAMKAKNDDLMKTVESDERKFRKMTLEIQTIRKDKDLTGLQLVRRNDEITTLKDKFDIMQTALDQGQAQYKSRLEDIRLLKNEVINLKSERDNLIRAIESTADMRREIVRLNNALNQERIKVRTLFEDVKLPTGVHRWRMLQGKDPSKMHLVEKINRMQQLSFKKDIQDKNLKVELETTKHEAKKLKGITEKLPTTDLGRRLVLEQHTNLVQSRKLKAALAELSILQVELKANYCEERKVKYASGSPAQDDDSESQEKPLKHEKNFELNCIESSESIKKTMWQPVDIKLTIGDHKRISKTHPKMKPQAKKKPSAAQDSSISDGCSQYLDDEYFKDIECRDNIDERSVSFATEAMLSEL